jgi:uncharacterized protein (DUF885 family)
MTLRFPCSVLVQTVLAVAIAISTKPLLAQVNDKSAESQTASTRRQQLQTLLNEEWEFELRTNPEMATTIGDNRYNDRLTDYSPEAIQANIGQRRKFLARFEGIDPRGFSQQDALSRTLMIRKLRQEVEGARFKSWEMPLNQMNGPHLELPELVTLTPFNAASDYETYVARLHQVPRMFEQLTTDMRQGMRDGLMPPRYLLEKVAAQAQEIANLKAEESPFAGPLKQFPAGISAPEQKQLREAVLVVIGKDVLPAYRRFAEFVARDYAPRGRTEPGIWSLPDGEARYRYDVRRMTTTDLTPDQIHQKGLEQVSEIEAEMLAIAQKLGFKDLASLNEHIKNDRHLYATSGEQLLGLYTTYTRQMEAELPKLFGRLPKTKLDVIPMQAVRAKNAVPADYREGTLDGSRPGRINVNEWEPEHRLLLNVEAIAYHEGVPGHHLQISIAHELPDIPMFRRYGDYTAFVEGWALYSERLGKEVGFYQDPYSDYGRLENEMWRAVRLVVDTGVHQKHWSRQRMVDFFHRYTAMDEPNVQTEIDRYIAWPGQALAYKLGQMEILKLREEARRKLGSQFDLRAFHDAVVGNGPLPLDVLHEHIEAWIADQAKAKSATAADTVTKPVNLN